MNFKLRKQHLYTIPILREGIAVKLGGRWGKAPSTLKDLGAFIYKNQILEIDSILTMTDFERRRGTPDRTSLIRSPVCSLIILLIASVQDKFFDLYRGTFGPF